METKTDESPLISAPVEINRISPQPAPPPKAGWKSTEFWLTTIASIALFTTDIVPGPWKVIPVAVYTLSRGIAKRR